MGVKAGKSVVVGQSARPGRICGGGEERAGFEMA